MTFAVEDLCFIDTEARAYPDTRGTQDGDLPSAGTYRYTRNAFVTVVTYAIGPTEPVREYSLDGGFDDGMAFHDLPDDLRLFWLEACKPGSGKRFVAWNMGFDWPALTRMIDDAPQLPSEACVCAMAQAQASNLPPDLMSASKAIGGGGKQTDGKYLISLFCSPGGATPQSHPEEWARFKSYAVTDTEELRRVWLATRALPIEEWQQYWAHQRCNDRGIAIDVDYVRRQAAIAEANVDRMNAELSRWTNGQIDRVTQTQKIAEWVYDRCSHAEAREILVKEYSEDALPDEEEGDLRTAKLSIARDRIERVVAFYETLDKTLKDGGGPGLEGQDRAILDVLSTRMYGGSSTPAKFQRMLDQMDDGRLKGGYVYNGAAQSGRYSSKGVQIHNLTNKVLKSPTTKKVVEEQAIVAIGDLPLPDSPTDRIVVPPSFLDGLRQFGSIARTQSLLVRPSLVAPPGKTLVWCDWSAIENRVLPWLADNRGSQVILDTFVANDADKSRPDNYILAASPVFGISAEEINRLYKSDDPAEVAEGSRMRQVGKVIVLSLGFGGGVGALLAMAAGYGTHFTEPEAKRIVDVYRESNAWAKSFWELVWDSVTKAVASPGEVFEAGRLAFMVDPGYLGGTLFCALPDGRLLSYPRIKWEMKKRYDKRTKTYSGEERLTLTFLKGYTRVSAWFGLFVNNAVQGTAASLQRRMHVKLREYEDWAPLVAHTHDENVVETDEDLADEARAMLLRLMRTNDPWNESLPLAAEAAVSWFYSKSAK